MADRREQPRQRAENHDEGDQRKAVATKLDPRDARPVDQAGRQQHALVEAHIAVEHHVAGKVGVECAEQHAGQPQHHAGKPRDRDSGLQQLAFHEAASRPAGHSQSFLIPPSNPLKPPAPPRRGKGQAKGKGGHVTEFSRGRGQNQLPRSIFCCYYYSNNWRVIMTTPVSMYAQSSGTHQTNSSTFEAIPGLSITLPEGVGTMGLVFLNVPMPYATGNNNPGGTFGLSINGTMSPVIAGFTYNEQQPPSYGRMPTTLILGVPLITAQQTVVAMWQNVRGSTVIIDSPATLSATFA